MIRMALGTCPNSAQWIETRTEGKYFYTDGGVFLIGHLFRVRLKMRLSLFLGPGATLGDNLYASCVFSSRSTFRIRVVVFFFVKRF